MSKLRREGAIQPRMPVTVEIDPDGRRAVEIFPSFRIDQTAAIALLDDHRNVLFPLLHLRERMPEVGMVPGGESSSFGSPGHERACVENDRPAGVSMRVDCASRGL